MLNNNKQKEQAFYQHFTRQERSILNRDNLKRIRQRQEQLYPNFPTEQTYDVLIVDPPWKYDKHTQPTNVPNYNTLSFIDLSYLPIRRIAKEDSILLMWSTAPMLDKAISLMKIYGYRYITIFQNWVKLKDGKPAQIKSNYSFGSSELLLWGEKGRTKHLKTPDTAQQVITSEIIQHSEKPNNIVFQNLIQKIHLNKLKNIEIFSRKQCLKYFDTYGDELDPKFQLYNSSNFINFTMNDVDTRLDEIMSKIKIAEQTEAMRNVIKEYTYAFALSKQEIAKTPIGKHNIRLLPNAVPIRHAPYRCSPKELDFMEKEIKILEDLGCIERCEATWVMPVTMVRKKDTEDLRMCIDFRKLNDCMLVENYPIPRIDYILSLLGKYKIFSKLDIKSGFWHIELVPECQEYTGFITPFGTFRWTVMPFGLKNAPATFQRIIEQALRPELNKICIVYIDDIIIFSNTVQEHISHIQKILHLLNDAQLRLGPDKCEFFQRHLDILGHQISDGTMKPQASKLQGIRDIPIPENRSQVRSFVGICSYYRAFIKDFTIKCNPLLKLTLLSQPFIWDTKCQESFELMKNELCLNPVLQTPRPDGQYVLQTDFSEKGLGAVLSQLLPNEDIPKVVEYASRTLRGAEINYPAYEGEMLAIHWALEKFRHYLYGVPFKLYTDNKALQQILSSTKMSKKIIRWILEMQEFTFTTEHRPGKENANADGLSRLFVIPDDINIKLSFNILQLSYQTYQTMFQGIRFDPECYLHSNVILSEGVGDIHCKICKSTHIKNPMLICECCGQGFHISCLTPKLLHVPKEAYYCIECLDNNKLIVQKDITMDFNVLDYIQNTLDISKFTQPELNSIRSKASLFIIKNNRIFYIKDGPHLLVPTIAERQLLVLEQHRILIHPSPEMLLNILRQNFYWQNMRILVDEITYNCQVCQARKLLTVPTSSYTPTDKGHCPFHTLSMDLAPELTITSKDNRHLLVVVDNFSKFVLLFPLKDKTSNTVADVIFNHIICIFGKPKVIRIDQGTEFKGDVADLADRWGIDMARATTFHPQSNGLAERMIQVVKRAITAAINDPDQPLEWDDACYPIQMTINSAQSRATGLSPFTVLFGRTMDIPQTIVYDVPLEHFQEPDVFELKSYMSRFLKFLKSYHAKLIEKRLQTDSTNKQVYEKLHIQKQTDFQPNQLVFLKRGTTSRWSLPNIGPFIFIKYTSKTKQAAFIKNPATNIITRQHTSNLSPWKVLHDLSEDIQI